jgi:hypothetical protein
LRTINVPDAIFSLKPPPEVLNVETLFQVVELLNEARATERTIGISVDFGVGLEGVA